MRIIRWCAGVAVLTAWIWTSGCATPGAQEPRSSRVFSVATYNVENMTPMDRDRDGEEDDPKPEEEMAALVRVFRQMRADIVALQEVGSGAELAELQRRLARAGLRYPYRDILDGADQSRRVAVLSRFPIVSSAEYVEDIFTLGGVEFHVNRGILAAEIEPRPGYNLVLLVVHLKSKRYHPQNSNLIRQEEAGIARSYVTSLLASKPGLNLILAGDMNDTPNTGAIRTLIGDEDGPAPPLVDLRFPDSDGLYWTQHWDYGDVYSRFDYLLASPGMVADAVPNGDDLPCKGRIVDHPAVGAASDHRPVQAWFYMDDR